MEVKSSCFIFGGVVAVILFYAINLDDKYLLIFEIWNSLVEIETLNVFFFFDSVFDYYGYCFWEYLIG